MGKHRKIGSQTYMVRICLDDDLREFMDKYNTEVKIWANFVREAMRYYIPIWLERRERYESYKHKFIN